MFPDVKRNKAPFKKELLLHWNVWNLGELWIKVRRFSQALRFWVPKPQNVTQVAVQMKISCIIKICFYFQNLQNVCSEHRVRFFSCEGIPMNQGRTALTSFQAPPLYIYIIIINTGINIEYAADSNKA